jgi:transcription elongation factor Elf1
MRNYKLIANWPEKKLTCFNCGTTKSVKYEMKNGKSACNLCVMTVACDKKDSVKKYKSNAQWPDCVAMGNAENTSTDDHYTEKEAESICKMLEKDGFGGDGLIFPIKTWVS